MAASERARMMQLDPNGMPSSGSANSPERPYDKVYTVGCFDLLHEGHLKLFRRLRLLGREVVVGIHDDDSIFKLKRLRVTDPLAERLASVARHADVVFAIPSTDPSLFVDAAIHLEAGERGVFCRGNDMIEFPGRETVEARGIEVLFFPYTKGVSSTILRQQGACEAAEAASQTSVLQAA